MKLLAKAKFSLVLLVFMIAVPSAKAQAPNPPGLKSDKKIGQIVTVPASLTVALAGDPLARVRMQVSRLRTAPLATKSTQVWESVVQRAKDQDKVSYDCKCQETNVSFSFPVVKAPN